MKRIGTAYVTCLLLLYVDIEKKLSLNSKRRVFDQKKSNSAKKDYYYY